MREPTHRLDGESRLYDLLQVSPAASQPVIKAAYHALARQWHPDVNATPEGGERIRQLNEAYEVLSEPASRAKYDLQRARLRRRRRLIGNVEVGVASGRQTPPMSVRPSRRSRPTKLRDHSVHSIRLGLAMAIVAAVVAALFLLLWVGMSANDDMRLLDRPPVFELGRN
ncbi:MAG: J domain-containing protein [Chloroflexota bacterium]|nr:J domain-containing protein [Chloroflexota bacterium]